MDQAEALTQLRSMCAADSHPTLDDTDLVLALDTARRADPSGNPPSNVDTADAWAASTQFAAGAVVVVGARWWWAAVTARTAPTPPSWPDLDGYPAGSTRVTDGDQTWLDNGAEWAPTWALRAAAADCWERKAAKAAGDYDFGADGQTFSRSQVVGQCLKMAARYRSAGSRSVEVVRC